MRACLTGIACLTFLCGGFWVFEYGMKRRRLKDKHVNTLVEEEREDRISQLPDDVISLVVSRLNMKEACRTSVLSRRWKHVYSLITDTQFYCYGMSNGSPPCYPREGQNLRELQRKFDHVLDSFLLHQYASRILSFEEAFCFRVFILDSFRQWMSSVGILGVDQVILGYCCPDHERKRNSPVFCFDFLSKAPPVKCLRLKGGSLRTSSQNALKHLELTYVALTLEAVESILLNCCSLEALKLKYCVIPSKLRIHGVALRLKYLMVSLSSQSVVTEIDLFAINLTTFELGTFKVMKLSFSNVPMLQNLFISSASYKDASYTFRKVTDDIPHLKYMLFSGDAGNFEIFKLDGVIKLSNLRELELDLCYCNNLDLQALATTFLDACPLLHKFHLSMAVPSTFKGRKAKKGVVKPHTQLKEVEFSGFSGTKNEWNLILYFLQNAVFLERLSLFMCYKSYSVDLGVWKDRAVNPSDERRSRAVQRRLGRVTVGKNVETICSLRNH